MENVKLAKNSGGGEYIYIFPPNLSPRGAKICMHCKECAAEYSPSNIKYLGIELLVRTSSPMYHASYMYWYESHLSMYAKEYRSTTGLLGV